MLDKEDKKINIYPIFINLVGIMLETKKVTILPFNESESPGINDTKEVPEEENAFKQYCQDARTISKGKYLIFSLRIATQEKFYKIKQQMFSWLQQHKTFISLTTLTSSKNCVIGWLMFAHIRFAHREDVKTRLKIRMGQDLPFDLTTRKIHANKSEEYTFALVVECAIKDAETIETKLYNALKEVKKDQRLCPTRKMKLIPLKEKREITNKTISKCIKSRGNNE